MATDENSLSKGAEFLARRMLGMVAPTAGQLSAGPDFSRDQVRRGLGKLRKADLVQEFNFGCNQPGVTHILMNPALLDLLGASDDQKSWHSPAAVGNVLLYDPLQLEAVTGICRIYAQEGFRLSRIQWCEKSPMSAIAEYSHPRLPWPAYQVFCALPLGDSRRDLVNRLDLIPRAVRARAGLPENESLRFSLCIVADDEWRANQALSMAGVVLSDRMSPEDVSAWCQSGGAWHCSDGRSIVSGKAQVDLPPLHPQRVTLPLWPSERKLGRQTVAGIMERSPWIGPSKQQLFEVFTLVGKFPVGSAAHYQALVGEGKEGQETLKRLEELIRMGLVKVVAHKARASARRLRAGVPVTISQRGQGGKRYALTKRGRREFWYAYGIGPTALYKRSGHSAFVAKRKQNEALEDPRQAECLFRHRDVVYEFLAQIRELGLAVAPGWLAHGYLATGRRFQPDGVVRMDGPSGPTWCYVEVELSQRSFKAFEDRCKKYGSQHRLDSHPLLMVLNDDRAEENFGKAVREFAPGLNVWTTTLRRLRENGVTGKGVWRAVD